MAVVLHHQLACRLSEFITPSIPGPATCKAASACSKLTAKATALNPLIPWKM